MKLSTTEIQRLFRLGNSLLSFRSSILIITECWTGSGLEIADHERVAASDVKIYDNLLLGFLVK